MNKMALAVFASISLLSACTSQSMQGSSQKYDKTYVVDSSGGPVKNGDSCIVAAGNNGQYFSECDGGTSAQETTETKMAQPEPKVITKVIVDCSKCKK